MSKNYANEHPKNKKKNQGSNVKVASYRPGKQLEVEGPPEITDAQMMAQMVEEYKNSYQPTQTQDANVILPSAIE